MVRSPHYYAHRLIEYVKRWFYTGIFSSGELRTQKRLEILAEMFRVINAFMRNENIPFWIDFGTLLGYYRGRSILRHDIDVDFSTLAEHFDQIWQNRGKLPQSMKMYDTSAYHLGPKLYISYKGFDADIYFYASHTEKYLRNTEADRPPSEVQDISISKLFPVVEAEFLGTTTFIPAQHEAYLTQVYGYTGANGIRDKKTGLWHPKDANR